jgi:hypothetical protein
MVCAMLLAQLLGLAHRVAHGGALQARGQAGPEWRVSLFDTHHDAADCRLFDQLSHADAPGVDLAQAPARVEPQAPALPTTRPDAAAAHGAYLARGPPALT